VVYHAANVLFRTENAGRTWRPISPDLTRNDRGKQKWSGGPITGDNTGVEVYGTLFAIAESPLAKGLLWAGSDDGLVHVSRDGGGHWDNVTPREVPEWGTVICVEPSPFEPGTAYAVVDAHKLDDRRPYLFRTADFGKTWTSLVGTPSGKAVEGPGPLPEVGSLRVVRADPKRKGMLYLGGERGLLVSRDDGQSWEAFRLNLPTVTVTDLAIKNDDLVVGTNGRSIWIFDDLTPVREWGNGGVEKEVYLFPPRPAIRYHYHPILERAGLLGAGENPPRGAPLYLFLKTKPKEVLLEVHDDKGNLVNSFTSKKPEEEDDVDFSSERYKVLRLPDKPGLHRVVWDLRWRGADVIKRARLDGGEPRMGPLVNPGTYTLRLSAGGQTATARLEVLHDFRAIPGALLEKLSQAVGTGGVPDLVAILRRVQPEALNTELDEQLKLALEVRDAISRVAKTVEQIRSVRGQLVARNQLIEPEARAAPLVKASKELLPRLDELEEKLHNPRAKVSYDILAQKGGAKLYSQLAWLFEMLKDGDGAPTQGVREVYAEQRDLLRQSVSDWQRLREGELARLNELAKKLELPGVIVPSAPQKEKPAQAATP
jgi:hypothetical protein